MVLNWKIGGPLLGVVFFLAVLLVQPIGVSTQFVVIDGVLWERNAPGLITQGPNGGWTSTYPYFAKYAKDIANPVNYSVIFVAAMMGGALLSAVAFGRIPLRERFSPALWSANFRTGWIGRWVLSFLGGVIVLYGARMAGGCTSGHMMSGMMQTAVSGYLFAFGAFLTAFPTARMLLKKEA
ncbi:YeeE/YedE family protein [Rhodovulum tesquicola]|uniref:YeeE/YedE thiosulfate transporter family protein n=1 Tax=Rhodovulum tesquicola TaxID=540254 RepID=UPI002096DA4A|nr:YeeE/YedE thiosulfate transporter family protein [Rhodovulum tesquicola]MCO8145547.1 YeeE/YedE family protein [Rhodovulum tesquicola]